MATYSKNTLSQSTGGLPITVTSTGLNFDIIHEGPALNTSVDEVWIYACNVAGTDVTLTLSIGDSVQNTAMIFTGVIEAYSGNVLVVPGFVIKGLGGYGSEGSLQIHANASAANSINLVGYVNQIQ